MKSIVLAVALIFSAHCLAWSQEFSTLVSKDGILVQSIQSFSLNDSLFVFFSSTGKKNFNSLLVLPDGTQKAFDLIELKDKAIATITSSDAHFQFYYFDTANDFVTLNVLLLNKRTGAKSNPDPISIPGRVIGYEGNDTLTVITYDRNTSLIHLQRFKNFSRFFANQYAANAQLFKGKVNFISRTDIVRPSDADADIKIFLQEKHLWILAENHENKSMGTTTVFKIEIKTGITATKAIFDISGEKWNTMLCGEMILKVVKSKGITLQAYDFQKSDPVFSSEYKEGGPISKERAYERRGVSNEVFSIDVQQALKAWGRPIVVPHREGNSIVLKIGNYEPKINPKSPVPVIGSGVMRLIFELARTGSYVLNDKVSDDRYFYLRGNFIDGFSMEPDPKVIEKVIDDYEIANRQKPMYINFKGYLSTQEAAFGFYKFEKHYDQIKIVKFDRQ